MTSDASTTPNGTVLARNTSSNRSTRQATPMPGEEPEEDGGATEERGGLGVHPAFVGRLDSTDRERQPPEERRRHQRHECRAEDDRRELTEVVPHLRGQPPLG